MPETFAARFAAARAAQEESDANFRWRLSKYMRSIGVPYGF